MTRVGSQRHSKKSPKCCFHLILCVLYGSHKEPQILAYTSPSDWFLITEVEIVYCAVRTESLYTAYYVSSLTFKNRASHI